MASVAEQQRKKAFRRKHTADVAEIGPPPITTEQREEGTRLRDLCRDSLLNFNTLIFPNSTGIKPFGQVQLQSIQHDESVIREGGRICKAEPRAYGKTTRTCNAALKAALYNERRMIPVFSANMEKSKSQIMARWKTELTSNQLLFWMFPELIWPLWALENKPQRCASQTYKGEPTNVKWTADRIVFPTISGVAGSGNILMALPLKSCRGATHTQPDGTILRPELLIFDDVQNDEDAENPATVRKLEELIDHSAMMLGGHSQTMSAIMNCTVRRPDDLSETFLAKSGWRRVRYKMLATPAVMEKELWLGQYADIRRRYDPESHEDQLRAHREALQFYADHRSEMDSGAVVTWEWAYAWGDREQTEISAIQHAYNILIDLGEAVFASECQNEPLRESGGLTILTPKQIAAKQSGYSRNEFPRECTVLTSFVDVHEQIHYYEVWAWEPNFTGYMIDWGTAPSQHSNEFLHDSLTFPLERYYPNIDDPARITAGLHALFLGSETLQLPGLLRREWIRGDGVPMKLSKCGIDANGLYSDAIKKFIRQHQIGSVLYPSFGKGVKATEMPMSRWTQAKGSGAGPEWVHTKGKLGDPIGIMFDANFWKTQFHKKLGLAHGANGSLYLYKVDTPAYHALAASHYYCEHPKEVAFGSRVVYEFPKSIKGDNHRLDCAVGNLVAASKAGIRSISVAAKREVKSLAELQRERWQRQGRV